MNAPAGGRQFLTFYVGDEQFAADAARVAEVFRRPRITRIPHSPPSLLGVAGLRGTAAPVVSLARLLGREEAETEASRLLLLNGGQPIGLMVERVGALAAAPPEAAGAEGGLYVVEGSALRLLDLDAMLRRDFASRQSGSRPALVADAATPAAAAEPTVSLLSFDLNGQAYALPLEEVVEVLAAPAQAAIAQSENAVLGVAELRGHVLPIVSAKALLGLAADRPAERVVVVRYGGSRIGLAVDRLRSIVRVPESRIDAAPAVLNRGEGEAQVQSICRLPDSGGLVAILSPARLFRDDKLAQVLADSRSEDTEMTVAESGDGGEGEQILVFRLGDEEYGLPLSAVDEVARLPERLTRVPRAPAFIEGVLNLRGKVTPIIDQRRRFASGGGEGAERARARIIVTTVEGRQAGFIVDAVSEIVRLGAGQAEQTPELAADAGRLFSRVASFDGGRRLILLVEPRELLDRAERDLLDAMET